MQVTPHERVVILGAGLQGAGVALELASRGIASTIIEQDPLPLNRASLRNEGKIHLGLIYANDRSGATARTQFDGAIRFAPIVDRWLLGSSDWLVRSTPFSYLVARDSVMTTDEVAQHFEAMRDYGLAQLAESPGLHYLGASLDHFAVQVTSHRFDRLLIDAVFETEELAIDTAVLCSAIRSALVASPLVDLRLGHVVRGIEAHGDAFRIGGDHAGGAWTMTCDELVNATWEQRPHLDQQIGIDPPAGLLHRLKFRVIARLPECLRSGPSATMVIGRYGDVVVRPDATAYLSWYPVGLQGWTHDVRPPQEWDAPCRGATPAELAAVLVPGILAGIDQWYPGMASARPLSLDAGAIVALGHTDVDDASSGLHLRSAIGVTSVGGFHSIDPGKLTTAPMFAVEAVDRIATRLGLVSPSTR